ncbi:MAG TPA: glycosyltransferase family 2 protein [Bacteroidales bacterium]|nr:glycosyltransferase family 2 protein [Bacteroidales bacterium]
MPKISAIIITYNEEDSIGRCLDSIKDIADEIIVVDSFSTDRTREICKEYNVRFISHEFEGYRDQKNFALQQATYQNILSLDADEALSDELRASILAIKNDDKWDYDGYKFNRRNYYCGTWIRFSEWYPDKQLRLFFADHGKFGELNLHEKFILSKGTKIGRLKGDLLHWAFLTREEHSKKMAKYAVIGAEEYHKAGRKATIFTPYIHSAWGFFRTYFIRGGLLDGMNGLRICSTYAGTAFRKYRMLYKLNKKGKSQPSKN